MITASALTIMVYIALGVTTLTPFILLSMVYRDWKRGVLW